MSYYKAKECFNDSFNYIDTRKDPVAHDVSAGLNQLTEALESDMAVIKNLLEQIANSLNRLLKK